MAPVWRLRLLLQFTTDGVTRLFFSRPLSIGNEKERKAARVRNTR